MSAKDPSAQEATPYGLEGSVEIVQHESRLLEGNALGDPHVRQLAIYLPPEHRSDPRRRFPSVYCLSGFTGSGVMFLNIEGWAPNLPQRYERLRARGEVDPMILVMPDCFTRLGGSQYLNSTATGPYEDYLAREIVPWVDARYRTDPTPTRRAVMGKSSGGYGALRLGMRRPDLFGAIASHSGDLYFEYCYLPDFPKAINGLRLHGGIAGFLRAFDAEPRKRSESLAVLNILAMAACYSPNPDLPPLGIDLPFELDTGRIRDDVWERWLRHDPLRLLETHAEALRRARLLYIDCGTRDEFHLHIGARIFAARLREMEIPHIHEEFDDGHMRITYRYERSLALLSQALCRG